MGWELMVKPCSWMEFIILSGIAWYYGDNDFIIQTFDFIASSDVRT